MPSAQQRLAELIDGYEWSRLEDGTLGEQIARIAEARGFLRGSLSIGEGRYIFPPDTVEQPKTVGDIRAAIDGLPDEAQAFINISGHGEDYAIAEVFASEQIPDGEPWPTDKRTIGLEIHLGLFREHPAAEEEAESDA